MEYPDMDVILSETSSLELENKFNMNKIVHVDNDIITLHEIHIPIQNSETEGVTNTENCNNIDANRNGFMKTRFKADYIIPVEFSVNENEGLRERMERKESETTPAGSKKTSVRNEIISSINEFNDVLKDVMDKENSMNEHNNTVAVPMPTLSETEFLLNTLDKTYHEITSNNADTQISIDATAIFEHSEIALPRLTFSETDKIIRNINVDYNSIIPFDYNYAKISRNNTAQLNPALNTIENGLINHEIEILEDTNGDDKELLKSFKESEFHMEFEFFLQETSKHDSYESKKDIIKRDETIENKDNIHVLDSSDEAELKLIPNEDVEIISISSDECITRASNVDSDCEGYHSSDFEIIDEKEACLSGLITKSDPKVESNSDDLKKDTDRLNFFSKYFGRPGSSNRNAFRTYNDVKLIEDQYWNDHVIPQDEDYLELFAQPWAMFQFEAENKAFHSSKEMDVEVDNVGFNIALLEKLHEENNTDPVYKQEAKESAKKILSMYPAENRKRRRRF